MFVRSWMPPARSRPPCSASPKVARCSLVAATYPERTRALVLYGTYGHFLSWVIPPDRIDAALERLEKNWGTGESLRLFAPSVASDETFKLSWARFERLGASPSAVVALMRMNSEIDARPILPWIRCRRSLFTDKGTFASTLKPGGSWPGKSRTRNISSCPAAITVVTGATERILDEVEEF